MIRVNNRHKIKKVLSIIEMNKINTLLLLSLVHFFFITLFSESIAETEPELITDRPDITESATVVPMKRLQIESGFIYVKKLRSVALDITSITFNSTLFRCGLNKYVELRLGLEYLGKYSINKISMNEIRDVGTGPLYLGMKLQINKEVGWLPEIAAIPGINLPFTAYLPFQTKSFEPELVMSFSNTLLNWLELGYNFGGVSDSENKNIFWWYSIALNSELDYGFGVYVELHSQFQSKKVSSHYLNGGIVYLATNNFQIDCSGGFGLNSNSPDVHWGFGFSWRIPR